MDKNRHFHTNLVMDEAAMQERLRSAILDLCTARGPLKSC